MITATATPPAGTPLPLDLSALAEDVVVEAAARLEDDSVEVVDEGRAEVDEVVVADELLDDVAALPSVLVAAESFESSSEVCVCFDGLEEDVSDAMAGGARVATAVGAAVELSPSSPRAALTALFMVSRRPCLGKIARVGKTC